MMQPFKRPLVIYHRGCRDGFCAAWVAHSFFMRGDVKCDAEPEFIAAQYGEPIEVDLLDRDVFILDFSYPRESMQAIQAVAHSLVVLDHHKTAQEALAGLGPSIHFDMSRSGAGMAWDHFWGSQRPWLVNYIEDRDLWAKKLPHTDEVNAFLSTMEFSFDVWDDFYGNMYIKSSPPLEVIAAGKAVIAKTAQYVREVMKNALCVKFHGHDTWLVNAPQIDISDLLHELAKRPMLHKGLPAPRIAMGWWQRDDGKFQYSLRSLDDIDVSVLAKKHGGGGHKNAAGFQAEGPLHLWW